MEELIASLEVEKNWPIILAASLVRIGLWLLLANAIRNTVKLVGIENRCIHPNQVWFIALPLFNIYWNFVVVRGLCDSLNNEFYDRKIEADENPTRKQGNIYAGSYLLSNIIFLPFSLQFVAGLVCFVYMFVYWAKVLECKKLLKAHIQQNPKFEASNEV